MSGYTKAQYQLSRLLSRETEDSSKVLEARRWLEAAAGGGQASAQYALACECLLQNDPETERQAYRWFRRAADKDHVKALYSVGVCHLKGTGTNKDPEQAYGWFRRAAAAGSERAETALLKLERKLDPAALARVRNSDTGSAR